MTRLLGAGTGKDLGLHPVGTGPFRFVSHSQDGAVVLERSQKAQVAREDFTTEGAGEIQSARRLGRQDAGVEVFRAQKARAQDDRSADGIQPKKRQQGCHTPRLGGDSVVAFEGFADLLIVDSALTTDTPVLAPEFNDGGGAHVGGFAGVEDERETIPKLGEDIDAASAGG